MKAVSLIFILMALPDANHAINCLVMRPGHGLVSEQCPSTTVGCRIKIRSDHIEWYEWSKLYDRNQLVCIYPGEYHSTAGCLRKPSGNVRCWCNGMNDCNDAITSQRLFDAFHTSDKQKMTAIIKQLETGTKHYDDDSDVKERTNTTSTTTTTTTTTITTTTTTTATTTSTTVAPSTRKVTTYGKIHMLDRATTFVPESTTLSTTTVETIENDLEPKEFFSSTAVSQFGKEFEETRRKLLEEMREEDERLQQLLADEEAEMMSDGVDSAEEREEQRRKERERNRMERRERARADEQRRLTEEEELRKHEKSQKHKEVLHSDENSDKYDENKQSIASSWTSIISSIITISFVMFRL